MYAASREAVAAVRENLPASAADAEQVGKDLFAVVGLLDGERALRRALADASTEASGRVSLVSRVLGNQISDGALDVVKAAAEQRWSSPRDLVDSLQLLARELRLRHAHQTGELDAVEDELFRLGRIVAGSPALERVLGDPTADAAGKRELMDNLLSGKATNTTKILVDQLVARHREEPADGLDSLAALAATLRERSVAHVRSAVALSAQQEERLAASLGRTYGREVTLHVEVDPELIGGMVVQVGDEVIDGSIAGRVDELRRRLAG
ncbi:F0F1 ATP synthase subunit delta [Rhodococcus sp. X156]|uniref:F0F1 ATP synthase subunit delta n=1 Tax=Rhodococcus sp. X156 TaxID=2499145 RepID=UPI000FD789F4|nr:F0F1 ATP synthase subunit delta [Rhodococcus sp. X156]